MKPLTSNALEVLNARYLLRNAEGTISETPEALFRRAAREAASTESITDNVTGVAYWEEQFYELMSGLYFLPNSPALMNAGTTINQLSACFVLPVEDGLDNIFKTLKNTVLIQQSNGGTGFNFSQLSARTGSSIENQFSLNPLETIEIFDSVVEKLKQRAKRAGANMAVLNVDHPDILDFINSKNSQLAFQNFNLSVGITDKFMEAVERDLNWDLKYFKSDKIIRSIRAVDLWKEIIDSSWRCGDPGLLFMDEIERKNPTPNIGKLECTNPCGEVPLLPYEACNLGSVNLSKFVQEKTNGEKTISWDELAEVVQKSVRLLDNIITRSNYLLPQIQETVYSNRKIGLGVMGWAEMLLLLEIPYNSNNAIILADKLMEFINKKAHEASHQLAIERGAFPNWKKSIYGTKYPLRNATCTSIAPTGSIAIIANTSPSIEPLFSLAFTRKGVLGNKTLIEFNSILQQKLEQYKLNSPALIDEIKETGKLPKHKSIPIALNELFLTAPEISPNIHIRHQNAFQKHTDNAVSKTINLSENATQDDVNNLLRYAWKLKLKGITIYRQGSRTAQIMNPGIEEMNPNQCGSSFCVD